MLEAWYADRPEVKAWQKATIAEAHETLHTTTLLGRRRHLPEINSMDRGRMNHSERAAINTYVFKEGIFHFP